MLQTVIVALVIVVAFAYVGRRIWTTLRPKSGAGCAHGCGCGNESASGDDWARSG